MTNKILFNLIGVKLTETELQQVMRGIEGGINVQFLIGGAWFRWDGSNFRGFDGEIADASPGDIRRAEVVDLEDDLHTQWHVTPEQFGLAHQRRQARSDNVEADPGNAGNRTDSLDPLSPGRPEGGTVAVDRGTGDPRGDGAEEQRLREQQSAEFKATQGEIDAPLSEKHSGAGLSTASKPGETVSAP